MTDTKVVLIARLRTVVELAERATPGPLTFVFRQTQDIGGDYIVREAKIIADGDQLIADVQDCEGDWTAEDFELFVALRNLIPDLSAAADALEKMEGLEAHCALLAASLKKERAETLERAAKECETMADAIEAKAPKSPFILTHRSDARRIRALQEDGS